jgi:uncharacterized protein YbbC (DUF1343 family)
MTINNTIIRRGKKLLFLLSVFPFFVCFFLFASPLSAELLRCGIDRLEASAFHELSGLKVGLITNRSSLSRNGEPNYALMLHYGVQLQYLMAPEHGFSIDNEAGKKVGSTVVDGRLPVYSLYGASVKPDSSQLHKVDVLVFDLQDIGTRCYTYISTMKYAMEACEKAGTAFMVLDRPNPVIPLHAEGFMLAPGYGSFVGAVDIPFIHSMTVGEIALFLKEHYYKKLDLRVIAMQGYGRDRYGDEYPGFHFLSPSPNIRSVDAAILYPVLVLLEATTVSEGRGTAAPFMQFGAPFIKSSEVASALEQYKLAGVVFHSVVFRPVSGKFKGERCFGLSLSVTDRKTFQPFRTAVAMLLELQRLYPDQIGLDNNGTFFDRLAGTPQLREMIRKQMPLEAVMHECQRQVERFKEQMPLTLLYK